VLKDEAACRLNQLDANSQTCVAALAEVHRDALQNITQVDTPKLNWSQETLDSFVLTLHYQLRATRLGSFRFEASWTDMLKHELQQFPTDPVIDLLNYPYIFPNGTDFKSKANASVTWEHNAWSSTVYADRMGKSPNYLATLFTEGYATPGAADLPPLTLANLEVGYQLTPRVQLTGTVVNVFNTMPPDDHTYPGTSLQPYNIFNYSNLGTSYRLEVRYKAGK
jgi:outer membrane receptor protein involved in Fe transport